MNKFGVLVFNKDLKVQRCYMNSEMIIAALNAHSDIVIYHAMKDQEAVVQDGKLFWIDVPYGDEYKE